MAWQLTCSQGHTWELSAKETSHSVTSCPKCLEVVVIPSITVQAELPPPREAQFHEESEKGAAGAQQKLGNYEGLMAALGEESRGEFDVNAEKLAGQDDFNWQTAAPARRRWRRFGVAAGVLILIGLFAWMLPRGGGDKPKETAGGTNQPAGDARPLTGSGAMRLRGTQVESLGGGAIKVTYNIENTLSVPLTVALRDGDYYVGRRTHMLERVGGDWRIKAIEKDCDVAGSRYILSARPTWTDPVIGPRQSMQFSITLDANALEKGKYRYWVQYRSVDFTGAGAGDEQYAEFDWAGTPITGAPAVAATLPQSPAVAPGAIAQAPSPVGAPLTAPPEEIAPVPAPIALPNPEPAKVGRAAVEAVKENAAPKTRQEEIEKAWKEAEIDTLNQGVLERDRRILAKMRRASEELLSMGNRLPVRRRVGNENGASVLNLYALLHAEQAIEDPRLKFSSPEMSWAVSDLVQLDTTATYTASLQTSALSMLPKRDVVLEALKRNQRNILSSNGDGSYTYQLNVEAPQASPGSAARARAGGGFTFDHSNTQYGNLGALALLDADMEVSMNYWQTISAHWRQTQCSDGGWDYTNGKNASTGTMTEAGLTALLTASYAEMSHVSPFRDNAIIRGFRAMEKHLDTGNVYASHNGYGLYGIERVGLTSGLKRIGGHEWYNEGIASILPNMDLQRPGFEQRVFDRNNLGSNSSKTAFELLFMTRGRNPVVMNKLQYDGAWDFHPWDLAYLTRWLSRTFERPLIWQVIGNKDPMDDWMDAPILLITGDQAFTVNDQLLTKLRNYVDAGGTILSVATRDSPAFTQFVIKLSNRLSRGTYEMRKMDKDDPFHSLYRKSENPPETWAMSNGVREIWIHSPRDIARDWQRNAVAQAASWDTPVNAYLYVNGKSPMKRRIFLTDPTAQVANGNFKKRVVVGRLNYAGNWNPEPGAWPLIGVWMARYGVQVTVVEVTAANLMRVKPDLLSITGTANFRPTKELGDAMDTYVAAGGTILADAAGGRSEFTESFTQLMRNSLEPIPMNDPLYDLRAEGVALRDNIEYRRSWILKNGQSAQARLRGAKSGADRYSIIFSPDDLTSGFLGTNTWGVLGYSPDTSRQIVRAVLEYATSK